MPDRAPDPKILQLAEAMGMVSEQVDCELPEALLLICERATVHHQNMFQIAGAVIERTIRFNE